MAWAALAGLGLGCGLLLRLPAFGLASVAIVATFSVLASTPGSTLVEFVARIAVAALVVQAGYCLGFCIRVACGVLMPGPGDRARPSAGA